MSRNWNVSLLLLSALSCGHGNTPEAAVATAGAGVLAAGINRKITHDCWASCPPGNWCDHEKGICVELPCRGECPSGKRCQRFGSGYECLYEGYLDRSGTLKHPTADDAGAVTTPDGGE